jgi:hypothetical protein
MSQKELCGQTNPFVTGARSLGAIFDSAASEFSLTVYESTGLCGLTNPFVTCEKSFEGFFGVGFD